MPTLNGRYPTVDKPYCCHPSTAIHTTEMALIVALIAEHSVIDATDGHPPSIDHELRRIEAHQKAAKAISRWRNASAIH